MSGGWGDSDGAGPPGWLMVVVVVLLVVAAVAYAVR